MENDSYSLISKAYAAFNARDVDAVLKLMDPSVDWPNGWEGGYVQGHEEVRNYWTRQWKELDPSVEPVSFEPLPDGRIKVGVHQLVKDLKGKVLFDGTVWHIYAFTEGKIKSMEIQSQ